MPATIRGAIRCRDKGRDAGRDGGRDDSDDGSDDSRGRSQMDFTIQFAPVVRGAPRKTSQAPRDIKGKKNTKRKK
jgi:hypothetical protein